MDSGQWKGFKNIMTGKNYELLLCIRKYVLTYMQISYAVVKLFI